MVHHHVDADSPYFYVTLSEGLVLIPLMYLTHQLIVRWIDARFGMAGPLIIIATAVYIQMNYITPLFFSD